MWKTHESSLNARMFTSICNETCHDMSVSSRWSIDVNYQELMIMVIPVFEGHNQLHVHSMAEAIAAVSPPGGLGVARRKWRG